MQESHAVPPAEPNRRWPDEEKLDQAGDWLRRWRESV
jgi:hypothetical protein